MFIKLGQLFTLVVEYTALIQLMKLLFVVSTGRSACLILLCRFTSLVLVFFYQAKIKLGPGSFSCFFPIELKQIRFALGTLEWD